MIAHRYVPAICALLALALVPTLIHSYSTTTVDDGLSAAGVPPTLVGFDSVPSGRSPDWGMQRFDSSDWIERNYVKGDDQVRVTVARSLDLKSLYHHPELAVAYGRRFGSSFADHEIRRFPSRPDVPVHVLHPQEGESALGLYILHYDGAYVEEPIWFQIRTAGNLLVSRRKPMTLLFAHDLQVAAGARVEELPAVQLLFAALDAFLKSGTGGR